MTRRGRVRAAEPTAAFSPQRKCKTVWSWSHLRNQKKNSIRMDAVLFCLRSPNAGPPPSRLAGRTGSRCTKQTLSLTFSRDPVVTSPTSATISRSQKRYHGFEPPKSHDFGGFSRVCSLFRNHEVCGYRVQKKRYHFKKTAPCRMLNSFRLRRKRSPHF